MDRYLAMATLWATSFTGAPVLVSPDLLASLDLADGQAYRLRLGRRQVQTPVMALDTLAADQIILPTRVAGRFPLNCTGPLAACRTGPREVTLGPLVGLLISRAKLAEMLAGRPDTIYCRFARYARETGAILCFFADDGLDVETKTIQGYWHGCTGDGCRWTPCRLPAPNVIYDRAFGPDGKAEAARVRELAGLLGATVINQPVKIAKLQVFAALARHPELAPHLPFTAPLTLDTLEQALERHTDLYLKPDALSKGQGVYRLVREPDGWSLQNRETWGNAAEPLGAQPAAALERHGFLAPGSDYLVQEGLDLATYLGNRFDFRSLVQKDGRGRWTVSGLAARIAPVGGAITSPRSGGEVATAERVLADAFPDCWEAVLADLKTTSVRLAAAVEQELGLCAELGLDVGVTRGGNVKLIEVNGRPLKVSLSRLNDPAVNERIHRYPIHYAVHLALGGDAP